MNELTLETHRFDALKRKARSFVGDVERKIRALAKTVGAILTLVGPALTQHCFDLLARHTYSFSLRPGVVEERFEQ